MQTFFTKKRISSFILASTLLAVCVVTTHSVFAQSGESIVKCGNDASTSSACTLGQIGPVVKGVMSLIVSIGLPLLFIFVAYRFVMAWFSLQQGNANAYKDALQKAGNAIVGFIIITALIGGGLYAVLSFFGIKPEFIQILKAFTVSDMFPHAYAQTTLPNPTPYNSLYDFILGALRLVMKFFIYPALIVIWVWTGFSFVLAQGAPEALTKAKKWLMWAFVTTIVIMVLQGFLFALKNSVNRILSDPAASGQACTTTDGRNGQMGTDNVCRVGGTR